MGHIIVSTEDLHLFPEADQCVEEFNGDRIETLRLYDEDGEEVAMFNFDHVVTHQPATEEEMEELVEHL